MTFDVVILDAAAQDLEEIDAFITVHDSPAKAAAVLHRIEAAIASLCNTANRGSRIVEEKQELGMPRHREIFFKPYRIIYEVRRDRVFVKMIADGRRNMRELLRRRLEET